VLFSSKTKRRVTIFVGLVHRVFRSSQHLDHINEPFPCRQMHRIITFFVAIKNVDSFFSQNTHVVASTIECCDPERIYFCLFRQHVYFDCMIEKHEAKHIRAMVSW